MLVFSDVERFNPWWRTGKVRQELVKDYKRKLYFEVETYVERRQISLVWGLRRVGKTTLLMQLVQELLKKTDPKRILYFSFDEQQFQLSDVLDTYQKMVLGSSFESSGKVYVFLDEIQKVSGWEGQLKTYYDLYPNVKFLISGSASVKLKRGSGESLAGRMMDFLLKPLSFWEFLEINGKDPEAMRKDSALWEREALPLFYRFIKYGSFPELALETDEAFARKYIMDSVVERVIYKDLPEEFEINDLELLKSITYLIGKNPGMTVNYAGLSKDFARDQRTVANYFEYLRFGLLIQLVFNYRGSPVASLRKSKKAYFSTCNIAFAFNEDFNAVLPKMLENVVCSELGAEFFYSNGFEIDFVIQEANGIAAIEVKKTGKEAGQIRKMRRKFGDKLKSAVIVDAEKEGVVGDAVGAVQILPIWKFLLDSHSAGTRKQEKV